MRFLRSRLFHFAIAGGLLYLVAARNASRERRVEIDPEALAAVHEAQAKKLGVSSLPEDGKREVDARAIEDEILYREALRLGLDRDDPIVKQRLVQKLLLLVEDLGGASREPTREELRAYFEATRERWKKPARYAIVHVFASSAERVPSTEVLAGATEPPAAGEAFPYPRATTSSRDEMARVFGTSFADGVAALRDGEVSGLLRSSFGWHRVRLVSRVDGGRASFDDVQKDVLLEYLLDRRERVVGAYMKSTLATYDVRVGSERLTGFIPTRRVAARVEGSAED